MTEEQERRLRSLAANIVDLELRIQNLRTRNTVQMTHEERQSAMGDLMVAEANLLSARSDAVWLKMGLKSPFKDPT